MRSLEAAAMAAVEHAFPDIDEEPRPLAATLAIAALAVLLPILTVRSLAAMLMQKARPIR